MLEVLHYQGDKFKQLFLIQFNTLFTNGNSIRFTKDQIDGVCKDIRYPEEFFIDIIFDNDKDIQSNIFEEDVIKFKNIISEFILKGYSGNKKNEIQEKEKNFLEENLNKIEDNKNKNLTSVYGYENDNENEDYDIQNTTKQVDQVLEKFKEKISDGKDNEEEDDDEDLDDYIKNLEKKGN